MKSEELWNEITKLLPEEVKRVEVKILPLPDTAERLYQEIDRHATNASIADGRMGFEGNDFEQPAKDLTNIALAMEKLLK